MERLCKLGNHPAGSGLGNCGAFSYSGAGHSALPWQEMLITALFMSVGCHCRVVDIVLWGLRGRLLRTQRSKSHHGDTEARRTAKPFHRG